MSLLLGLLWLQGFALTVWLSQFPPSCDRLLLLTPHCTLEHTRPIVLTMFTTLAVVGRVAATACVGVPILVLAVASVILWPGDDSHNATEISTEQVTLLLTPLAHKTGCCCFLDTAGCLASLKPGWGPASA